jgi:hypothetical protein
MAVRLVVVALEAKLFLPLGLLLEAGDAVVAVKKAALEGVPGPRIIIHSAFFGHRPVSLLIDLFDRPFHART